MTHAILSSLRGFKAQPLTDIQFLGILEVNPNDAEFILSHQTAYFTFGESIIEVRADSATSRLIVRSMDLIKTSAMGFDDVIPAFVSVARLLLWESEVSNLVARITLYGVDSTDPDSLTASAISIELQNGQELFIDALSSLGLNVGGNEHRKVWQEHQAKIPGYLAESMEL
ncbi:MAG: hypothetical protein RLZZ519_3220 [Bacteroidota bacterium]|jgi:hypothetical protein